MLLLSESDPRRAERYARRRARARNNKQRRELVKTAIWIFSLLILGISLWTVRKVQLAEYGMEFEKGADEAGHFKNGTSTNTDLGLERKKRMMGVAELKQGAEDRRPVRGGEHMGMGQGNSSESGEAGKDVRLGRVSAVDGSQVLNKEGAGAVKQGEVDAQPPAPGLLSPAKQEVPPRVESREENEIEEVAERGKHEVEVDGGSQKGDMEEEEKEQGDDEGGDDISDSLDDEEGGRAPVITLARNGGGASDEREGGDNDGEEDGDGE